MGKISLLHHKRLSTFKHPNFSDSNPEKKHDRKKNQYFKSMKIQKFSLKF